MPGIWRGRSRPGWRGELFQDKSSLCQTSAASLAGPDKWFKSFIASILAAAAFWVVRLSWYRCLPWMAQDQFRSEKWGKKKRYNVQAFSLVGEAPEITCHDDLFRENTVSFSGWSISLTLDDRVPGSPTSTPHRPSLCIQIRYISEVPAQFPLLIYKFLQYRWLCCLSNCKPSCSSRMPPRQTAGCACVPFISSLSFPRKRARYGSFTAPKGCSLRKPSRQLFQVVETLKWCGFRAVWPFVGISAVPRVYRISLWLSASCRRRAASLRHLGCGVAQRGERAQQRGSSVSVEMWGFFLLIFPRFFFFFAELFVSSVSWFP